MIMGIGVDTVNIERFERIVTETRSLRPPRLHPNERTRNRTLPSRTDLPPKKQSQSTPEHPPDSTGKTAEVAPPPKAANPISSFRAPSPAEPKNSASTAFTLADPRRTHVAIAIATAEYLSDAELAHLQSSTPEARPTSASSPVMTPRRPTRVKPIQSHINTTTRVTP